MPADMTLTALAPQQHIGATQSSQPTLAWFVPTEATYDTLLQIYEYVDGNWRIVSEQNMGQSQYGYMDYRVPAALNLNAGGLYRWQVVLFCDPNRPSRNQIAGAEFEIVGPTVLPQTPLENTAESSLQARLSKVEQFLEAGLWYDAVDELSTPSLTEETTVYLSDLLLDLSIVEASVLGASEAEHVSPLQSVAAALLN